MKRIINIITLLVLFNNILHAEKATDISDYRFRHYSIEEGIPSNCITSIIQDSKGYIWIGTDMGLCKFNGTDFITLGYEKNDSILRKKTITSIFEKGNHILLGTEYGIYEYNNSTQTTKELELITQDNKKYSPIVNHITSDINGNLWIATGKDGIFMYSETNNTAIQYQIPDTHLPLLRVLTDSNNNIWATGMDNLYKLNKTTNKFEVFKIEGYEHGIYSMAILEDSNGNIWIGTWNDGLLKVNTINHTTETFLSPNNDSQGIIHIHSITQTDTNTIYIGSDNGLTIFNTDSGSNYTLNCSNSAVGSLSDRFIYPITKDKEGGIWIGTYYNGINYLPPFTSQFKGYDEGRQNNEFFTGKIISRFIEDDSGNLWIGSDDGGLSLYSQSEDKFINFKNRQSLEKLNIHAFCIDNENLWIGTYSDGIKILNTKNWTISNLTNNNLYDSSIYSLYKDENNNIWAGTMTGICMFDRSRNLFIPKLETNTLVIETVEDKNNNIWFATQGSGVIKYNKSKDKWYTFDTKKMINHICVDKNDSLWIATSEGLFMLNKENGEYRHISLPIKNDCINTIIEADDFLWIATAKGLVRYNMLTSETQVFTKSDGLQSEAFVVASGIKTKSGEIFRGTINGFNSFYPYKLKRNTLKPNVVFTKLEIFNKPVSIGENGILEYSIDEAKEINLSHKDNVFSIQFAALSFCTPEKNNYAYMLEGFDKEWNYVGNQNKATYTNLPPKEYTFKVRASNNDGIWNEEGKSIKIIVHPPFYLTLPFKILYVILILTILGLIMKYIIAKNNKKHNLVIANITASKEKEVQEAKINFFTMIAHEIRTPVSLIIGPLEKVMSETGNLPEGLRNDLEVIDRNSQRLLYLVNQLLDFRKVEQNEMKMHFKSQDIKDLVKAVCERFAPSLKQKGVALNVLYPEQDFTAHVDREALTKVISNLMTNANKYTKDSINVIVSLDTNSQTFSISVKDNGQGMRTEEMKQIFKPFYQASENKPGTGIGLSIVKGIVEAHNGKINVDSKINEGSSFTITLPIVQKDAITDNNSENNEIPDDIIPEQIEMTNSNEHPFMLIVDDNEDMINFLSESFKSNYTILTASDGIEALERLKEQEVSLIITDWMMPNMDGIELCKAIRSKQTLSHIPIILLTAKTDNKSKVEGMNCGADAYIEKPFSLQYLEACIKNLLEMRLQLRAKFSKMPMVPIHTIAANSSDEQFLSKLNSIIEENFANQDLSVDFLAEKLCISRSGLFAKIKGLANITPNEMIQIVRLKKAAALLLEGKYRINEVSFMVGFNNASYFSKCFQKQFGMKPGEFVASQKQQTIQ